MSDNKKPDKGSKPAADAAVDKGDDKAEGSAPPAADAAARKVRRKPVWVCVPVEWEEVAVHDEDGSMRSEKQPTRYSMTECPGGEGQKKAILRILAEHQVDPANYGGVMMFRADPIKFEISQQMIIRIN